ncbi:MAG: M23 family metallopeptidase [archaeon]
MSPYKLSKNIYRLPFTGAVDVRPAPYHFEKIWQRNAVDFALAVGKPIFAVKDGRVFEVVDGRGIGKPNKKCANLANLVIIEHQGDEYSEYVHLRKGILVKEGQQVNSGQIIGYSGVSGYTTYPHLHFGTLVIDSAGDWMTIPTRFRMNGRVKVLISPKD